MEVQKGHMASPYRCRVDSQRHKSMNSMSATNDVRVVEYHQSCIDYTHILCFSVFPMIRAGVWLMCYGCQGKFEK